MKETFGKIDTQEIVHWTFETDCVDCVIIRRNGAVWCSMSETVRRPGAPTLPEKVYFAARKLMGWD